MKLRVVVESSEGGVEGVVEGRMEEVVERRRLVVVVDDDFKACLVNDGLSLSINTLWNTE